VTGFALIAGPAAGGAITECLGWQCGRFLGGVALLVTIFSASSATGLPANFDTGFAAAMKAAAALSLPGAVVGQRIMKTVADNTLALVNSEIGLGPKPSKAYIIRTYGEI
jgi:hypothetical protein